MTNVEKLTKLGMLGGIRRRLGAKDGNDTSCDASINEMDADVLMWNWSAWELGDGSWWYDLKSKYDFLCEK